jgi:hypothetical protein
VGCARAHRYDAFDETRDIAQSQDATNIFNQWVAELLGQVSRKLEVNLIAARGRAVPICAYSQRRSEMVTVLARRRFRGSRTSSGLSVVWTALTAVRIWFSVTSLHGPYGGRAGDRYE